MTKNVPVHGAWHGSWCWGRIRRLLVSEGHEAFMPDELTTLLLQRM
jgi:hypothetical protein